ncbi:ABC-type multidrug transport system, ATPase and permease component [Fodinibius roseus]|uniref:ABC-type multidrug transport system, ATPase and permease component n=1 Tax=Fodinibius roseus TaxID=1194090 RepID=A0A1M5J0L6_9BACT|nr:ABC transporter ATP-binding protein [Fodinibius roseus]SHG34127.1 ABC-type multidrug transport system, ATPase and permease component [Fodinibius roseus]
MIESLKKIYTLFPSSDHYKLLILFGMMLLASLLEVLGIGMIPVFVSTVASPDKVLNYPVLGDLLLSLGVSDSESLVIYGALLLIGVYIVKNTYLGFFLYIKKRFIENRGVYLQDRIFRAYMTAPYSFYINRNSAELLRNVTSEVNKIISGTLMPFMEVTLNFTMFLFIIGTLFLFEPLITVISIVVLGGGGYLFLHYTKQKTKEYGKDNREARKEKNKAVLQGLNGFKDARVLNREESFLDHYRFNAERSKRANTYEYVVGKMPKPIIETIAVAGILSIALLMVWQGRDVASIIPVLSLFGAATVKLMPVLNQVINQSTKIRYNAYSVYAIYDDLKILENDYRTFRMKVLGDQDKIAFDHQIVLNSVTYSYPNADEKAVQEVSIDIPEGGVVAFVGPSGAGKTTLVDIILGLLEPQKGTIEADGVDIFEQIRGWQKNIGYIPQSIYLLDDTIKRNIAFGILDDEIDDQKLWDAIEAAQLIELVERLAEGVETIVGERGVRLSGGQQQRIGIARALYDNPQVLVMDEATSSLDNLTEKYVIKAIERLRGDRTIIMIAHRLSTVKNCDVIYMMKEGKVVDAGTYEELLEQSADFRKMSLAD